MTCAILAMMWKWTVGHACLLQLSSHDLWCNVLRRRKAGGHTHHSVSSLPADTYDLAEEGSEDDGDDGML
jgi:hypothetical protein